MLTELVKSRPEPTAAGRPRYIPIDATVDLELGNPVAQLGAGRSLRRDDVHVLLSALGHRAGGRGDGVLELLRNVL